jgi:uncharacterized protein
MSQIQDRLVEFNPWWAGPYHIEIHARDIHSDLRSSMALRQALAVTGLRRVGKTTLLLKLGEEAVRGGLDPRRLLYFSFDEFADLRIRELLRAYEQVQHKDWRSGRMLLLLDEVQKLPRWQEELKVLYDRYPNLKFVLSGSESLFIRKGWTESLAGRLLEFKVEPLSFREYLSFAGVTWQPLELHRPAVMRALDAFTRTQGFPELVGVDDLAKVRRHLRDSVVEKVLLRDLPRLVGVRNVGGLESILNILMEEPGQLIEYSSLATDLAITRQTVSAYLTFLEQAFLVRKLYNFSGSRRKVERKLRKYYPSVVSPDLTFRHDDQARARVFEWLIVQQLRPSYFWRDPAQKEVDAVFPGPPALPVEVKSGKVETRGVSAFMERHGVRQGYIISRDRDETIRVKNGRIDVVPAPEFLLKTPKGARAAA